MAQHLSIRVPWKDNGYEGLVCEKPCYNNACLRLKGIAEKRDDSLEDELRGCPIKGHEQDIPCLTEGACFMSEVPHKLTTVHPYKKGNPKTHGHFLETELVYPQFSFPARPFAWTMAVKNNNGVTVKIEDVAKRFAFNYEKKREPKLPFDTIWVQDAVNQREIFSAFYKDVEPKKSLVIPYAKQVPFIEDSKRVVMGIGYVTSVVEPPEHKHTEEGNLRSILWETMIGHSIRNDRKNGFLLPYREMLEYAKEHPDFDVRSIVVFADDDYFEEFSYVTEHVSYDATISILLQIEKSLNIIKNCIPGNWGECLVWVRERIDEVWKDRGIYPGLGSVLYALGYPCGEAMYRELKKQVKNPDDYPKLLVKALDKPEKYFSKNVCKLVKEYASDAYQSLSVERKNLFWLLARMSLTIDQACVVFCTENRMSSIWNVDCSDSDILENPYILYEKTRECPINGIIPVRKIDMAIFPPEIIRDLSPVPEPSQLVSGIDKRRARAHIVWLLEELALQGHTVYPISFILKDLREMPIEPELNITGDIINGKEFTDFFKTELKSIECKNGELAFQLNRLSKYDDVITRAVNKRLKGTRHVVNEDWRAIVDERFKDEKIVTERDEKARTEKAAILKELAESRLSVLIGGAGTGKTTLLSMLCKSSKIQDGGVLLLAPTGKARVRMGETMRIQGIQCTAQTVAQFLGKSKRFDGLMMRYKLSDEPAKNVPDTVIIDESSMLTEEMFGALLEALRKDAKRIIFVGDPNQLPPIGAGRPFVDLVRKLKPESNQFPRVAKGFGELTITMRQISADGSPRGDTELAKWFADIDDVLDDEIFRKLEDGTLSKYVVLKKWSTPEELEEKIFDTLVDETEMDDVDDIQGFNISLGGEISNGWMNFADSEKNIKKVENWQILSAYRADPAIGTGSINRYIHQKYRSQDSIVLPQCRVRSTRKLLGLDGIVYGDKVINIINHKKVGYCYDTKKTVDGYVANGEVGIVHNLKGDYHHIMFSSQPEINYSWKSQVSDEGSNDIELAYALTVHKSQGSEFNKAILVLAEPSNMLSKELLYTAITRQKDKLIILYNDEAYKLRNYSLPTTSEIARRFTCLFEAPDIVEHKNRYFEKNLIHMTLRGDLVRSKSEVIIANMLYQSGIKDYEYEKELDLGEDGIRIPDFTIEDAESGITYYWEHCGMLGVKKYADNWEYKKKIYSKHGIVEGENLLVSEDAPDGSINSQAIKKIIEEYLLD